MADARRWPGVSVVVPSTGRPQLLEAVMSVAAQDYPGEVQTVVVLDGSQPTDLVPERLDRSRVTVLSTGRRAGANAARNLGTRSADGDLVAYLDDDDEWTPGKLTAQVRARRTAPSALVSTCRVRFRRAGGQELSRPVPHEVVGPGTQVEDYLFRRRRPSLGRATIQTSTLLCERELALAVAWDEQLARHQDWDWIIRTQEEAGATFLMSPEDLVVCATGSSGSISASPDWASSLDWALRRGASWSEATLVDFLVGQTLRYALQARSARGVAAVLRAVARSRRAPSWQASLVGAGGLLPRRTFETVALTSGRQR